IASAPIISDCDIFNNGDYAISMYAHNVNQIGFVTITGNAKNSIRVWEGHVSDGTWANHDVPYVIDGNITVDDGQTLTIEPGTVLRFNGRYVFKVDGSLVAIGTEGNPIRFTSNKLVPAPGDWEQLYFNNSEFSTLINCNISYGGSNTAAVNMLNSNPLFNQVFVISSATNGINLSNSSPEIINGWITESAGIGIISSFDSDPTLNSISIFENGDYAISMYADNIKNIIGDMEILLNGKNSIKVEDETVHTGTWLNHSGVHNVPYIIAGNISVADGETLTLNPGVELRFNGDYVFEVNGALVADGTEQFPIIFTSNKENPAPGDWRSLSFFNCDPGTLLDYCVIIYGGSNTAALNLSLSSFPISNSIVRFSEQRGINLSQSSPTIRGSVIRDNLGNGVHIMSGRPDLGNVKDFGRNAFLSNGGWEVYNNTPDTIYAQYNDWESFDSLTIDTNNIFDDDENPSKGIVIFMPPQKVTDVKEITESEILKEFVVEQNYPNPFNPSTKINFSIPKESFVTLEVFNTLGERVGLLISEELGSGTYRADFSAISLTSGIYFYTLKADDFAQTKKMILIK
ncbi:MAG: T9SS type A sorting domain-containing protein, partial [Ignavibacteriaceae bacterium]